MSSEHGIKRGCFFHVCATVFLTAALVLSCLLFILFAISAGTAGVQAGLCSYADDDEEDSGSGIPSDSLTVKVGYTGQKPETLKTYSIAELEALGTIDQVFTWITRVHGCVIHTTRGVSLKEILLDAGIDIKSVARIHFTCSDAHETEELTVGYLFNQKKYYYPNLVKVWDYDEGKAGKGAADGKVEVEAVLALQDYWKKTTSNEDEPEPYANMISNKRLRLCFGMTDTVKATSFNSAKWVRSIEITLAGSPPKEDDGNKDDGKSKGSTKGDKPDKDKKTGKAAGSHAAGGDNSNTPGSGKTGTDAGPEDNDPADSTSSLKFTLLTVDGAGSDTRRDGYQPWRANEMSEGASVYHPPGTDNDMAGPVAGAMGGLVVFGGALHYFFLRRLN